MSTLPSWLADIPDRVTVIGEVKQRSPFGWTSPARWGNSYEMLDALDGSPHIDWVSVHTSELWGGSMNWLRLARKETKKPILAKGFHCTKMEVDECFAAGADYVLTVGWWPGDDRCIHECEDFDELGTSAAPKVLWNRRNPRTGKVYEADFTVARDVVRTFAPVQQWVCQASGIKSAADVHPRADAVLIGEALWS